MILDLKGCSTTVKPDKIDSPLNVTIIDVLGHEMILGSDMLRKGGGVIDYQKQTMTWHGRPWPLHFGRGAGYDSLGPLLPVTGNEKIDELIRRNDDIFAATGDPIGECPLPPMQIETTGEPVAQRPYHMPLTKRKFVDETIDEIIKRIL